MRKKAIELLMAVLLLVGAFFLSKEGAELVSKELSQDAKSNRGRCRTWRH